jgi:hypothetical protein
MKLKNSVKEMSKSILAIVIDFAVLILMLISCSIVFGLLLWVITFGQLFNFIYPSYQAFGFSDLGAFGGMFMLLLFVYVFAVRDLTNWFSKMLEEYKTYKNIKKYKEVKCVHNKAIGLLLICGLLGLCGCSSSQTDVTEQFKLPPELSEYKIIYLYSETGQTLYVLVKKNQENREIIGTTHSSKASTHLIVIDGEEYSKVEKVKLEKE